MDYKALFSRRSRVLHFVLAAAVPAMAAAIVALAWIQIGPGQASANHGGGLGWHYNGLITNNASGDGCGSAHSSGVWYNKITQYPFWAKVDKVDFGGREKRGWNVQLSLLSHENTQYMRWAPGTSGGGEWQLVLSQGPFAMADAPSGCSAFTWNLWGNDVDLLDGARVRNQLSWMWNTWGSTKTNWLFGPYNEHFLE